MSATLPGWYWLGVVEHGDKFVAGISVVLLLWRCDRCMYSVAALGRWWYFGATTDLGRRGLGGEGRGRGAGGLARHSTIEPLTLSFGTSEHGQTVVRSGISIKVLVLLRPGLLGLARSFFWWW